MKARKFQRGDVNKPNYRGGSLTEKDVLKPLVRIINAICHLHMRSVSNVTFRTKVLKQPRSDRSRGREGHVLLCLMMGSAM
jgi:hypothetical protein